MSARTHAALAAFALTALFAKGLRAQACCAGAAAITPGRLSMHEEQLLGLRAIGAFGLGSFDDAGTYHANPDRTAEIDLGQDLFGAVRVAPRAQLALLVPFVETIRRTPTLSEAGGGLGDVNMSGRYDFLWAGQRRFVPGVAGLVGLTLPTGTPPDAARSPLATDATGIGAFQGNLGVSLEEIAGPLLFSLTGLVAARTSRSVSGVRETLGPVFTGLLSAAWSFDNDAAVAVSLSLSAEPSADIDGVEAPGTARRALQGSLAGVYPLSDHLRLQAATSVLPPARGFGRNTLASISSSLALVRTW